MDSKRSQLAAALSALSGEDTLSAMASVGEYKRALKDLDKGGAEIAFDGEAFSVSVAGETVRLGPKNDFSCSCISHSICRHILAAITAVSNAEGSAEALAASDDFSKTELDPEGIRAAVGAKTYNSAVKKYAACVIRREKQPGTLRYDVNSARLLFAGGAGPESAVCSCGARLCEHAAIALLHEYVLRTGKSADGAETELDERAFALIDKALVFLSELLKKGVYSAGAEDADICMFYALNLSTFSRALGRSMRSLAGCIERAAENAALIPERELAGYFCRAVNLLGICADNRGDPAFLSSLLGERRAAYYPCPKKEFLCLGAYPFATHSGYAGVTHLLAEVGGSEIYSATDVLPTVYSNEREDLYKKTRSQYMRSPLAGLAGLHIQLNNFRMSKSLSINCTEQTSAIRLGEFDISALSGLNAFLNDYPELAAGERAADYFESFERPRLILLPFDALFAEFDRLGGETGITFERGSDSVSAVLRFGEVTSRAADKLEEGISGGGVAVLSARGNKREFLTLISKNLKNLYFGD